MTALSKKDLEAAEHELGLTEDGLTYQLRLSRIATIRKGETWEPPQNQEPKRGNLTSPDQDPSATPTTRLHPLHGKRLLITPMMRQDKNRSLYFDEVLGHEMEVEEVNAGKLLYGAGEDVDRMITDYKIVRSNPNKTVIAKTTLPKSGQEISWEIGKELVPVVRGNDGQRGYIWIMPTHMRQYGETMIQIYGLKTLIQQVYPELLPKFSGKPVMSYIDGETLAASIPLTDAILKEQRRKELQDAKLGLV